MSDLPLTILKKLHDEGEVKDSRQSFPDVETKQVQAAVTSLKARSMVDFRAIEQDIWSPTAEGNDIIANGSHEIRLYDLVSKLDGLKLSEVATKLGPSGKLGQQRAFKNGWVEKNGDTLVASSKTTPVDTTQDQLKQIAETGSLDSDKDLAELKKRKLVTKTKLIYFEITKGPEFSLTIAKYETDITSDLIASGKWKEAKFKPYNFKAEGIDPNAGAFHPLNKVRHVFREAFFSMGFTEMPTNHYVESGFWNFDTLFVPQQHPARDLQDTFYIKDPIKAKEPEDKTYWKNVKEVHQEGKYGSIGYRYPWNGDESLRLVLRTHTTAVSAAVLKKLAANPGPARYFSIDRVFRNEAVDATHLAEFHQVEGVIADYGLTLGDLIGFMQKFFANMGVHQLRFKPAYNPYTEPSMEIFGYHEGLKKWVEIGNSGMFRPEMLEAMGLPKNLRVHGFGLSLERPTMIKYGVSNIRELLGHKVRLDFIENNPAVRFEDNN